MEEHKVTMECVVCKRDTEDFVPQLDRAGEPIFMCNECDGTHEWDDLPGVVAHFRVDTRFSDDPVWLVVEKGGTRMFTQLWRKKEIKKGIRAVVEEGVLATTHTYEMLEHSEKRD